MTKQTIFLFIRALIIGILLNIGVQQVSETPAAVQQQTLPVQQNQPSASQSSSSANIQLHN